MKSIHVHFLLALMVFQACKMVNPTESIPTYIKIDSVRLISTDPLIHGSVSHKITDVWVYYNRQLLGAFQLPAKVPVLSTVRGELQIVAGIWENGLSGMRAKYPFYSLDTFSFNPSPAGIIDHIPTFNYRTGDSLSTVYLNYDFEQGNSFGPLYGDTTFIKTNTPEDVFEGNWSDKLELSDTAKFGQSATVIDYTLPNDKMCYLELNYKNDVPFELKAEVHQSSSVFNVKLIGVNTSDKWGKIYVNFGTIAASYPNATFKFVIEATLPAGRTSGKVLIDNFKIIHFK